MSHTIDTEVLASLAFVAQTTMLDSPVASTDNGHRHGEYLLESDVVEQFRPLFCDYMRRRSQSWRLGAEVTVGRTIADLVGLLILNESAPVLPAWLSITESVVLSALRRFGATRIDLLEKRCGAPRTGLRRGALRRLADHGLILFGHGGRITSSGAFSDVFRLIAVEAKLTRWRVALSQAIAYRRYADEAYVLIPAERSRAVLKNAGEFEKQGIGLWILREGIIDVVVDARPWHDHDWRREFVLSRVANVDPSL
jgi:hypothetical protein